MGWRNPYHIQRLREIDRWGGKIEIHPEFAMSMWTTDELIVIANRLDRSYRVMEKNGWLEKITPAQTSPGWVGYQITPKGYANLDF